MPDLIGVLRQLDALEFGLAIGIKQAQLNLGGVRREDREIDSQPVPGGAQGEGKTFTDTRRRQNLRRRRLFFYS